MNHTTIYDMVMERRYRLRVIAIAYGCLCAANQANKDFRIASDDNFETDLELLNRF